MSIKKLSTLIICLIGANSVYANLSPEVIGSCKNQKSVDNSVIFTKIMVHYIRTNHFDDACSCN